MAITNIMTASLLSADNSVKMAMIQHGTKNSMDGQAGILKAEIKLDSGRGADVTKKKEELKETEKKASELEGSMMNTLSETNDELKKAAKEDLEAGRAEKTEEKKKAEKTEEKKRAETSPEGAVIDVVVDGVTPEKGLPETMGVSVDKKI
ncbi:MAG: hypothetical protein K5886_11425 [Lachnospiraceae bacterium]|nr:hypothetical protein [Lachnospiraceae bacterium]